MTPKDKWNPKEAMASLRDSIGRLGRKPRILLVEDDESDVDLTRKYLDAYAGEVVVAGNGEAAIELLLRENFDIAFVDLRLPMVNGAQVIAQVREQKPFQKFVVITAFADEDITQKLLKSGTLLVIEKPIKREHLEWIFAL